MPLSAFTHVEQHAVPITVNHQGQFPGGDAVVQSCAQRLARRCGERCQPGERRTAACRPASKANFKARLQAFQASLANEPILILAALITVYIVLGVLYESYIHPITILSTLPSAGVGALLALFICRQDFSVIALIGIILLIGIVKKNGIMMIDFALDAERNQGMPPHEAIYQACLLRFRPIMMTTMAALLGGLPLALGTGVGSELRRPAGHHDGRRTDLQPAADAVHHAGDLSLVRSAGAPFRAHGSRPWIRVWRRRWSGGLSA